MNFKQLYNNSNLKKLIETDLKNNMVNHAYFLHGADQELIVQFSLLIAEQIFLYYNNNYISQDVLTHKVHTNTHSDLFIYPKEKEKVVKVEDANNIVNESYIIPLESTYKIFIINNFELTNVSAQNKLLKTLEEPSNNVVFIINSTSISNVLQTIKSRCKMVYVANLSKTELHSFAVENVKNISKPKLNEILNNCGNSLTGLIKLVKGSESAIKSNLIKVFCNMKNSSNLAQTSATIIENDATLINFFTEIQEFFTNAIKLSNKVLIEQTKYMPELEEVVKTLSVKGLTEIFNYSGEIIKQLTSNSNKIASLESFLFKFLEVKHKCQK